VEWLSDGTRYPSVEKQPLSIDELKVWAYWAQHRPRSMGRLSLHWPGGFSAWLRQHYAEAEHVAAQMMLDDPTLTTDIARQLALFVWHRPKRLSDFVFVNAGLPDVRRRPTHMEISTAHLLAAFNLWPKDSNRNAPLIVDVVADQCSRAVVHAVDRVTVVHDVVGLAPGRGRHPLVPEVLPERPHLFLKLRWLVKASIVSTNAFVRVVERQ